MADFLFSQDIAGAGGPRGIVNNENTCYINAALQCLLSCSGLKELFVSSAYTQYLNSNSRYSLVVTKEFGNLMTELSTPSLDAIDEPEVLLVALKKLWVGFEKGKQMDVHEFVLFLLKVLDEDLKLHGISDNFRNGDFSHESVYYWRQHELSPISYLLSIQIVTQLSCIACGFVNHDYEDLTNHLSLGILSSKSNSIEDCLKIFFAEECLPSIKCRSCFVGGVKHQLILGKVPPILIVHLKRFESFTRGCTSKITKMVDFAASLNVGKYCIKDLQTVKNYQLVGVVNHHGPSLHGGHYTAICRRGQRWYLVNDTQVSGVTSRRLCTSSAYVLFLKKEDAENKLPFDLFSVATMHDVLKSARADSAPLDNDKNDDLSFDPDESSELCYDSDLELSPSPMPSDSPLVNPLVDNCVVDNSGSPNPNLHLFTPLPPSPDLLGEDCDQKNYVDKLDNLTLNQDAKLPPSPDLFDEEVPMDFDENNNVNTLDAVTLNMTSHQNIQPSPCQHPDFDLDLIDPILTEDDIPGAKLDLDNLGSYTNDQLKFWLACRGLHQTGNKPDLERRILNHRRLAHKINPGFKQGKWYNKKRQRLMDEAHDFNKRYPMMPLPFGKSVWKSFPSVHIPNKYSFSSAQEYLELIPEVRFSELGIIVEKTQEESRNDEEDDLFDYTLPTQEDRKRHFISGTLKRADLFIDSGRVLSLEDCQKDKHYFVKGLVQASMKNLIYGVNIAISQSSGKVCMADCCCWVKAIGRCAHIMAVLLLIERHVQQQGHAAITCTGRKCYWIAPSTSTVKQPGVVREKCDYNTKRDFFRRGHFDPRATKFQVDTDEDRVKEFIDNVSKMDARVLWFYHFNREEVEEEEQVYEGEGHEEEEYPDIEMTISISEMCSYLIWNLNQIRHHSSSEPLHFPLTQKQSDSNFWTFERAVRVPASLAKQAIGLLSPRSTASGKINFMRKLVWQLDPFRNAAMEYGSNLEENARNAYAKHLKIKQQDLDVIETGMWVNPRFPQISCSPDGIIVDTNGFVGLLEIKCPLVLKNMDPKDFELLPQEQLKHFCLARCKETGQVQLKKSNLWYYQVQQSLNILNLQTCHFVVYSEVEMLVSGARHPEKVPKFLSLEIPYDETFWKEKRERLLAVHRELIVPEYFLYNSIFRRPIKQLVYMSHHEDHEDDYFYLGCEPQLTMMVENESEVLINYSQQ